MDLEHRWVYKTFYIVTSFLTMSLSSAKGEWLSSERSGFGGPLFRLSVLTAEKLGPVVRA